MVKEIERVGIPIVHLTNMVPVALSIGSNRILKGVSIPFPACDCNLPEEERYQNRYELVEKGIEALMTEQKEQVVYTVS